MRCEEVMTKNIVCCLLNESVMKAAQKMKISDIGSVPVIENEENRKLVGIISDRDLAIRIVGEGRDSKTVEVKEVMTKNVMTCQAVDDAQRALDLMAANQLRRIPVVDNNNRIIGIIAQADIATRLNQPEKTAEVVKDISEPNKLLR
jgi:CBS domain-containing protein